MTARQARRLSKKEYKTFEHDIIHAIDDCIKSAAEHGKYFIQVSSSCFHNRELNDKWYCDSTLRDHVETHYKRRGFIVDKAQDFTQIYWGKKA